MARPREFDPEEILTRVAGVFRANGFEKTSFRHLERATGLKKGSLFAAYGNKHALFTSALSHYHEQRCRELAELCEEKSAAIALKHWLESSIEQDSRASCERGCLTLNSLVETAPHDRHCARLVGEQLQRVEQILEKLVRRAIKEGSFRKSLDAQCTAKYLVCLVSGLQALTRIPHTCALAKKQKDFVSFILNTLR
ncbi:MAG: TetR/AcrR family transcriptional regulator [Deltaproteobacteria bacterium]|nr:TetR/AcrR family transcriptional regulator [Deltaproteobacteria bacterium]